MYLSSLEAEYLSRRFVSGENKSPGRERLSAKREPRSRARRDPGVATAGVAPSRPRALLRHRRAGSRDSPAGPVAGAVGGRAAGLAELRAPRGFRLRDGLRDRTGS